MPKQIVTDKLRSYGAARRQVMPTVEHRSHKGLNNRAENSHLPLRKRERAAGISISRRPATLPVYLLCSPKSLRPASLETLSHRRPPASPYSARTLKGHCGCGRMIQAHLSMMLTANLTLLGNRCDATAPLDREEAQARAGARLLMDTSRSEPRRSQRALLALG